MKKRKAPTNAETRLVTAKGLLGHTLYYGKTRLFLTVIAVVSVFPSAMVLRTCYLQCEETGNDSHATYVESWVYHLFPGHP